MQQSGSGERHTRNISELLARHDPSRKQPLVWSLHSRPLCLLQQHDTPIVCLREQGCDAPAWDSLLLPPPVHEQRELETSREGKRALELQLADSERCCVCGPGRTQCGLSRFSQLAVPSPLFHVVVPRGCSCVELVDPVGDHKAL